MTMPLTEFDRFMPGHGIRIYPDILYVDANYVDHNLRKVCRLLFDVDPAYSALRERLQLRQYQPDYGRKFCTYVFKSGDLIGSLVYREILNSPYGYGKGDFLVAKRVLPDYRHTKYARYMAGDMIHIMIKSGLANNLYTYVTVKDWKADPTNIWAVADLRNPPCAGKVYTSDGPTVQRYMIIKHLTPTYAVLEFNGEIYKSMDLVKYFMAAAGRTEALAKRWVNEMDEAAGIVRDTLVCTSV